ncbi:hypothetical protein EDC04DRAFT_1726262 [Pisolithus marmoratus]|nr:hypothetical protein EDC04DRAFT_1726262 [Pisolithus marmoratus]
MSRSKTPNPNQNSSVYDENLLVDAPQATRAQLREGYDVDLLGGGQPQRSRSVRGSAASATPAPPPLTPPPVPGGPLTLSVTRDGSKEFGESGGVYVSKTPKGFWRSRKGIITAVVIVVVIIGAVVGGAVGGTTKGSGGKPPGSSTVVSSTSTSQLSAATGSPNSGGAAGSQVSGPHGGGGRSYSHIFPRSLALGLSNTWSALLMYHNHRLR